MSAGEIHIAVAIIVFTILAVLEGRLPRRAFRFSRRVRVFSNVSLALINNFLLQISFPILAVGASRIAEERGWGLFCWLDWSPVLEGVVGVLLMDLMIYGQHVAFHLIPFLWSFHRVHHADLDLDASTGIRFHTIEIFISMGLKIGFIFLLGLSPVSVLVFEVLLMCTSMFNHANLDIPVRFDRVLRLLIVTPDVHRVHHSIRRDETNSNYGFNFPWWDRIFGTYRAQPRDGHQEMELGIELFRSERWLRLHRLLIAPFVNSRG